MRKKRKQVNLSVGRGEKSKTGGLTAKGRAKYNRATGSKKITYQHRRKKKKK